MSDESFVTVGRIVKAHGLKGEVSVAPATGLPFVVREGLHVWITPPPAGVRDGVVESVRSGPKGPLVKIRGVETIDDAALIRGCSLVARPQDLPELEGLDGDDPVGLQVVTDSGIELGTVVELIETGANDVWVVHGDVHGEVLLPVIDDVVLELDVQARTVLVHVLPGLIEGEDD